jgi:glycosyltransferase involved in cell wall biosynthesis
VKILFIHQNFPAQFAQLAQHLIEQSGNELLALMQPPGRSFEGVGVVPYRFQHGTQSDIHPLLSEMEAKVLRGEAVADAALRLKSKGWLPDAIIGHPGWGELLFIRDIFPDAKLVVYCEYYYRATGQDFNFDPEFSDDSQETLQRMKLKNTVMLNALAEADAAYSPTEWQRQTYPAHLRDRIEVIHDGIDTDYFKPNAEAVFQIANKNVILRSGDEVITYAARSLEPVRGFHQFMRSLPAVLEKRPNAHVVIMGAVPASYGSEPNNFQSWQDKMLAEVGHLLDSQRVHFTGFLPKEQYVAALQISKVHVYLTYPFLLSWSMLEAMACSALVIGSDTAPVTEIFKSGKNGVTVPFFDTAKLAQTLVTQLKSTSEKNQTIRRTARISIEKDFDRTDCVNNLLKLLTQKI